MRQIKLSIAELRNFYSDECLTISSVPEAIIPGLKALNFKGKILSEKLQSDELILLNPHASDVLEKVNPNFTYILGGIVDKSRRIKTHSLWYDVPQKRVEFKGSVVGVPDRINLLIKILCENSIGVPLQTSILNNMPRREKSERVKMEYSRGKSISEISNFLEILEPEVRKFIRQ